VDPTPNANSYLVALDDVVPRSVFILFTYSFVLRDIVEAVLFLLLIDYLLCAVNREILREHVQHLRRDRSVGLAVEVAEKGV
jgi:hypothetical protein